MKFGYVLLYVSDVEKTLEFYQAAFGATRRFFHDEGGQAYGELETGTTILGFVSHSLAEANGVDAGRSSMDGPAPPMDLGFVVEDVDTAFQRAVNVGAKAVTQPAAKPWGQRLGYVRDINGFLIGIGTEVSS